MNSFNIFISLSFIAGIIGYLIVRSIQKGSRDKQARRKEFLYRFQQTRLPRMMQALGINFSSWFYKARPSEVEKSVTDCEQCESTKVCDEQLRIPELNPKDIPFCSSRDRMAPFSREQRIKGEQKN